MANRMNREMLEIREREIIREFFSQTDVKPPSWNTRPFGLRFNHDGLTPDFNGLPSDRQV
jgi:hypothetical protein